MPTQPSVVSQLVLRLASGTRLAERLNRYLTFGVAGGGLIRIDARFPGVANAFCQLAEGRAGLATLVSLASNGVGATAVKQFHHCLSQLKRAGACEYVWNADGRPYAIVHPVCADFQFGEMALGNETPVRLSRFAYVRRNGSQTVIESPEALCRIILSCAEAWHWLGLLAGQASLATASEEEGPWASLFVDLLWRTGFLERADTAEPSARACWEFHDLLFHWRTREGRSVEPQGGTYRHLHAWPSPPAVKPRMAGGTHLLAKPAIQDSTPDGGLIDIVERRRTIREQGTRPISAAQIGQLLYHALRVQRRLPGEHQELLMRPVPAAGAIHELEAYVLVNRCDDLERGLYHYHSEQHTLHHLVCREPELTALVENAAASWAKPDDPPQVLIILASRFTRLAWKYEGIAYRLTLLNAGAVIECLYLLATEMKLACSAIGGGDSAAFAAATGLDPFLETSIAEFAVGSAR